ncbi:hypothetical protein KQH60_04950 [Mycetohabitans sp. B8]|uniref:hypothetical protein n=1 Tax=Mycetohabitans sp. B8 TaxID=2841845 RepID=UPI001F48006F|nr:hypothetical protein [Mycetohabitans sp. B8]MCG1041952.1 hypothetical protein [Mycetohabitans sp. B8]
MPFLTRLGKRYGAAMNIKDMRLLLMPIDSAPHGEQPQEARQRQADECRWILSGVRDSGRMEIQSVIAAAQRLV